VLSVSEEHFQQDFKVSHVSNKLNHIHFLKKFVIAGDKDAMACPLLISVLARAADTQAIDDGINEAVLVLLMSFLAQHSHELFDDIGN